MSFPDRMKGLWCHSCGTGIFSLEEIILNVGDGRVTSLSSVKAVTCVGCGSRWAWDGSVPGVCKVAPIASTEAKRMISECREKEWDSQFQKIDEAVTLPEAENV